VAVILVADDEQPIRQMVRAACGLQGHEVHEAVDGPSAVVAYEKVKPDLLVLDIRMPGGGGPFALNALRFGGSRAIAPVLVITGTVQGSPEEIRQRYGVDRVLLKPFRIQDLQAAIADLLRLRPKTSRSPPPPPPEIVLPEGSDEG
jgi:two-component system OmpR family response regulator/two-component system alkaline phosphatase synthesis response regulator PhoP